MHIDDNGVPPPEPTQRNGNPAEVAASIGKVVGWSIAISRVCGSATLILITLEVPANVRVIRVFRGQFAR